MSALTEVDRVCLGIRSPQIAGATRRGETAFVEGESRDSCPYADHKGKAGNVTFSRAFRNAWLDGFDAAGKDARV